VASPWGRDILIYEGPIKCFDVDAANDAGVMHVAFQKDDPEDAQFHVYRSEDGGMTWVDQGIRIGYRTAGGGWPLKDKIKIVNWNEYLFLFYMSYDGRPVMVKFQSDFRGDRFSIHPLGSAGGDPLGFDAAYIPALDLLVFAYYNWNSNDVRVRFIDPHSPQPTWVVGD